MAPLRQPYVQRNHLSARTNDTPPQITSTSNRPDCEPNEAPSRITARSASLSAVSGNALMKGWAIAGNLWYEKNTPEKIHIGIMTRLIRPETLSIFCARQAVSRPTPPKVTAPSEPRKMTDRIDLHPCTRM